MKKKGVSVVIPCYNAEKTITKCIESIIGNKYCCEIIIIDDGSKDNSLGIIKKIAKNNSIVQYYHKDNGGVSSARNMGLEKSNGEYILFVDSDDYIGEKSIDNSYEFALNNNLDICNFRMKEINFIRANEENKKGTTNNEIFDKKNISEAFFKTSIYSSCAKLIKKDIIVQNRISFIEKLTYSEDYIFILNVCKYINRIGFCKKAIYYVENINPNSISKSYVKNIEESISEKRKIQNEIFEIYPKYKEKYFEYYMGREHFWFISYCDNLFKNGSPYSFTKALKLIRKKYQKLKKHKEFKDKSKETKPKRKMDKIYYLLIHLHSSLLIGLALKIKNILIQKSIKRKG